RPAARQGAGGQMELGLLSAGRREMRQGRRAVRHADGADLGRGRLGRCGFRLTRLDTGRRKGRRHGQVGRDPASAGMVQKAGAGPAARCLRLGRRSNNKILVSGKSALIMNPPSAWAVAKRDAPKVAEQLWTFPAPKGPKGRYEPFLPYYWTVRSFSQNKPAAKSLRTHLSQRASVEQMVAASQGYDIPPYDKLRD